MNKNLDKHNSTKPDTVLKLHQDQELIIMKTEYFSMVAMETAHLIKLKVTVQKRKNLMFYRKMKSKLYFQEKVRK